MRNIIGCISWLILISTLSFIIGSAYTGYRDYFVLNIMLYTCGLSFVIVAIFYNDFFDG